MGSTPDVLFDNVDKRYRIVVSSDELNRETSVPCAFLARGTLHSKHPPYPNKGEVPITYPDPLSPNYFPQSFRFKLSLFQALCLVSLKKTLIDSARFRNLGKSDPRLLCVFEDELRSIFSGGTASLPTTQPRKSPCLVKDARSGNVVEIHQRGVLAQGKYVVVSHDTIHDYYNEDGFLCVPIANGAQTDIFKKYDLYGLAYRNFPYEGISCQRVDSIMRTELVDLRAACESMLGL